MNTDYISFDLGTNFDYQLFDYIDKYDKKHSITNLFGKLKKDGLPGGRMAAVIPDLTFDELEKYVNECKKRDIDFNYLINPLALDQHEMDPIEGKKIRNFIHQAYEIGIREFTLNSPMIIKYVKKNFPDIFVTLGLYAYPATIQQIEYWRNWGVDEITLDQTFNRKLDRLRALFTQYKDTDLHLRVIANNLCLKECPFRIAHSSYVGHSDPELYAMDYSLINCLYHKISNPTALLTSDWIRPEDVHYYRELAEDVGYKNFSIKLVERTRTTDFLEKVIKAYTSENFDGNLLEILNWPDTKNMCFSQEKPAGGPPQEMPMGAPPQGMPAGGPPQGIPAGGPPPGLPKFRYMEFLKPESMMNYGRTMRFPNIYVDNKKLDGFFEHFVKGSSCDKTLCAQSVAIGDIEKMHNICKHCYNWAKEVISYDEAEVAQWKELAYNTLTGIESGSIYRNNG